jgi:hypothetical protein
VEGMKDMYAENEHFSVKPFEKKNVKLIFKPKDNGVILIL